MISRVSPTALDHGIETSRRKSGGRREPGHSFDLVLAFSLLGMALISAVALIGDLAYALPWTVSLILGVLPIIAIVLVGFAVFTRKRK